MISTDRQIFNEKSAVRARMIEQSKMYKELHIIIFSTKKYEQQTISPNCTIYSTDSYARWNYVSNAYKIGKKIIKNISGESQLLLTCQDPFETGLVGKKLANLSKNSELLLQIHTDLFSPYFTKHSFLNRVRVLVSKFTLPDALVVRVVSNKIGESLLKKGFKEDEIIVKPIAVNTENIRNSKPSFDLRAKFPQFKKIVLVASRLEPEKNLEMAIEGFKIASDKQEGLGMIIVGSGKEMARLKRLAFNLKIDQKVVFEGWQTDLVSYYKGSDVLLLASWYEGYGMVLKEAEAAGLKIVSTDVGIAREVGAEIVDWKRESIAAGLLKMSA